MKTETINRRVDDLITEINHHYHKAELLQLMQEQLTDDLTTPYERRPITVGTNCAGTSANKKGY